jgi:hypothetical protein
MRNSTVMGGVSRRPRLDLNQHTLQRTYLPLVLRTIRWSQ